ncbi:hypothetical protein [Geodermatophilus amargosae]|nr:hypothetical protein [Geodermatophilus amargosae]
MPAHLCSFDWRDPRWGAEPIVGDYVGSGTWTPEGERAYNAAWNRWHEARQVWLHAHPGFDTWSRWDRLRDQLRPDDGPDGAA